MKGLLAVVFICALVSTAFASFARKSLAGPPEEFAAHVVPNPESVKIEERSVTQNVFLQRSGTVFVDTASIPVDGASEFFFSYASPYAKNTVLSLTDPSGNAVDLSKYVVEVRTTFSSHLSIPILLIVALPPNGLHVADIRIKHNSVILLSFFSCIFCC